MFICVFDTLDEILMHVVDVLHKFLGVVYERLFAVVMAAHLFSLTQMQSKFVWHVQLEKALDFLFLKYVRRGACVRRLRALNKTESLYLLRRV